MARRHPVVPSAAVLPASPEAAARVAWAYLASLLAAVVAGLLVVIADQALVPLFCPGSTEGTLDDAAATCQLAWALSTAILGFLAVLAPILLLLKQDWWLWLAFVAGLSLLVVADAVTQWWWWLSLLLLPAAAALASTRWSAGTRVWAIQRGVILACAVVAVGLLVWWYVGG